MLVGLLALLGGGAVLAAKALRNDPDGPAPEGAPVTKATDTRKPVEPPLPPKDVVAPVVTVAEPAEAETLTTAEKVVVKGTVSDAGGPLSGVSLADGAASIPVQTDGTFVYEVAPDLDQERVITLVATDAAKNASAPVVRKVRREATWAASLRDALKALSEEDGDATKAALARPEAKDIPAEKLVPLNAFVKAWDAEPAIVVTSTAPTSEDPPAGEPRAMRLVGTLTSGRKGDRVFMDGRDVTVPPGGFEAVLRRGAAGKADVPYEIRSGSVVRKQGTIPVTFQDPVLPDTTPEWAKGVVSKEQLAEAARLRQPVAFESPLGMRFVLIPAGTFEMGSPPDEADRLESETRHKVTLTKSFYLQTTEVTFSQYQRWQPAHGLQPAFDRQWPAKYALDDPLQPVVNVSQVKAKEFAAWVSQQGDERTYRLPTEAEWERACRAGTTGPWWWGAQAAEAARCANVGDRDWNAGTWKMGDDYIAQFDFAVNDGHVVSAPVGSYRANPWGLHDMLGNVWEMCSDWAQVWPATDQVDPSVRVAPGGSNRVAQGLAGATLGMVTGDGPGTIIKGGCWGEHRWSLRAASRASLHPTKDFDVIGFRLVVDLK
jgi:formylglycine-generating enzyme required for sulfatase activity